jgi:hypothetical protein
MYTIENIGAISHLSTILPSKCNKTMNNIGFPASIFFYCIYSLFIFIMNFNVFEKIDQKKAFLMDF